MINSTYPNVKLTFEQEQQIEATKEILRNLESEITIAQKALKGVKLECDRAVKEKAYLEEINSNLANDIEIIKSVKSELDISYNTLNTSYIEKTKELEAKVKINQEKETFLMDKENALNIKESEIKDQEIKINKKIEDLNIASDIHKNKVNKLKEAIKEM